MSPSAHRGEPPGIGGADAIKPDAVAAAVVGGGLLPAGEPVVVLLSGGRDSVCLLDLAARLAGRDAVRALHCNYGLRAGADADEAHCRQLCADLGLAIEVCHPRSPRSGNLQAWARQARYAAAFAAAGDRARVAAGHTASDQAETVLYRLAASPGRRALLGMAARRGRLVRPLLSFSRQATADYCRARNLPWREDPSNMDLRFARVRARQGLLPALRQLHPAAEENLARTVTELRAESEALDALVAEVLSGGHAVEIARLRSLAPALSRLVTRRLAEDVAGAPAPDAATRLGEMLALDDGRAAGELHLSGGLRAIVAAGMLRFALPDTVAPAD